MRVWRTADGALLGEALRHGDHSRVVRGGGRGTVGPHRLTAVKRRFGRELGDPFELLMLR